MNGGRLASGTGSALCIKIGKYDHLHPVNITMSSPSRDAEQVVFGVPRLSDDLFDLPYITSHAASDYVFNMVTMNSTVYSVRDIHRYCSEASDSKLKTGKLVSVTGVILKRELLEAAAFEDIATSKLESISDGSGIALVAVSDADALCELLQLPPQDLESVYQAAAQSSDGKLVWKQRSRQDGAIQLTGAQDLLGVAATTVTKSTVLRIEGVLQSTEAVTADEAVMRPIMGGKIMQPSKKIRLTNVAIVRLRQSGMRFEIACYKNKVTEWRMGVEKDIDEVLQIHQVYVNVSKGQVAKTEDLEKCFSTDNIDEVLKIILKKGEQQVSDKERQHQQHNMLRDIATVVADMCVNPSTQQPHTVTMIEKAMSDIHFSVNHNRSAKQQALDVIRQIQEHNTLPISRAQMRIRIVMPAKDAKRIRDRVMELVASVEDEERGEMYELVCLIDPGQYRVLGDLISSETKGTGEVVILSLKNTNEEGSTFM
ncbi:hypothetical protein GGH99_002122 [Coemansia sp. RSA 1285]|nr:hypothetical protein GGH99_002122 [Coemansia sp. RSA 1285]